MLRWECGDILRRMTLLVALATLASIGPVSVVRAAEQTGATLDSNIAPHDPALDATIASLVRRGLLPRTEHDAQAPVKAASQTSGRSSTPAVAAPSTRKPAASAGWRSSSSILKSNSPASDRIAALPAESDPSPEPRTAPTEPLRAADEVSAAPLPAARPLNPHSAAASETGTLAEATPESSETANGLDVEDPTPDADHLSLAETDDEELAPIDELPEEPAPAADTPGDGRVDDLGEKEIADAKLAADAKLGKTASAKPSVVDSQATPLGEPDRIEVRAKNSPPPADPGAFQQADAPAEKLAPLTRSQIALRDKVRRVLKYYYDRPLNTGNRSPWEVMHCMLSYELHSRVRQEGPQGAPITAVGWLCFNQPCKGRTLMYLNQDGALRVKVGPALQGHQGQLLAILAQARVRSDYPIKVQGKDFSIDDLIAVEKSTCYPRTELTFKLIGLLNYLDINETWMNDQGMQWDFPTLISEEIRQPIRTAACGGTHRLSGLSLAVKKRKKVGLPVDGQYARAAQFVANYQNYAYRLQNSDSSFSTEWFRGPGDEPDIDRRLKTTGHTLEWLIYATPEDQLAYYRMVRAVNYLSNILWANRGRDWEAGPLGHALHALVLYDRLVYAKRDGQSIAAQPDAQPVAQQPKTNSRRSRR